MGLTRIGHYDDAVVARRCAVEASPADPEAHYNLAQALSGQGALAAAVDRSEAALELREDFVAAHNGLGNVHVNLGDLHYAISCFENALRFRPDYAIALNNLGLAF